MQWINPNHYCPHPDVPIVVKMHFGERQAIFRSGGMHYLYTDCTHPLMNAYLNWSEVIGWRFVNIEDLEAAKFTVNTYWHQCEGAKIIQSINTLRPSWWQKTLNIFK